MNEQMLPEDFSRWPDDPFALLGVPRDVSERDLRRAYARLIRAYKPEQFPEHFRRIREAYEAARSYASYFRAFTAPADSSDRSAKSPPAGEPVATPCEDVESGPDLPTPRPRPPSFEEDLDEAWAWTIDGDEARAYARLLELQDRHPQRSEICLRLYCLLSAAPELDARRTPCELLVQGLRQTGGSGPCHELYQREVQEHPAEALGERFTALLDSTTQPGLLATFVQWRWSAAGRQQRFDLIGQDLPRLRARFAVDQEEIWLRLLAAAADQLAWDPAPTNPAGLPQCLQEIARHQHLQLRCAGVFDRLEDLQRTTVGWHLLRKKGNVPTDLLELLRCFWTRPFAEIRRSVTALLAAFTAETEAGLAHLDRIRETSPDVLALFGRMLDSYEWTLNLDEDGRDPAEVAALARRFLEEHARLTYAKLRPRLLTFCLRERVPPEAIAELASLQTVVLPEGRVKTLVSDWPLRHVYRACTLFQG